MTNSMISDDGNAPTLALDVDGVLLDYLGGFIPWLRSIGETVVGKAPEVRDWSFRTVLPLRASDEIVDLIRDFAVSPEFGRLVSFEGAAEAVEDIRRLNPSLRIVAVTSAGSSPVTEALRRENLRHFPIDDLTVLPLGASKRDRLSLLPRGSVLVDDLLANVLTAEDCGHVGILFRRPYNAVHEHSAVVHDWSECRNLLAALIDGRHRPLSADAA